MVGFTESDFAGFKSIQQNNDLSYQYFTKKDLRHSWYLWHWFCESCYNYERMQGLGFCTAMIPLLRKIYKGDDEAMIAAMKRQSMFFNTDHDFGGMILGICASMEEQKRSGADIPDEAFVALKSGLMGPWRRYRRHSVSGRSAARSVRYFHQPRNAGRCLGSDRLHRSVHGHLLWCRLLDAERRL